MKQFSLDEYLKNPNKKITTRDGVPVRIICTDKVCDNKGSQKPIIALVNFGNKEVAYPYSSDGVSSPLLSNFDLFFAPVKREGWINLYKDNKDDIVTDKFVMHSEKDALIQRDIYKDSYIATIKIEWEE